MQMFGVKFYQTNKSNIIIVSAMISCTGFVRMFLNIANK